MNDKISKLNKGQIFKTYKDMCEYFGEEITDGNKKKAQLKEWKRYIKFKIRKDKSIIIEDIYSEPLQKVDNRGNNNVVYTNLIQLILLDFLAKNAEAEQNYINISKADLYLQLGLISEMYVAEFMHQYKQTAIHKEQIKKWREENNLSDFAMGSFYRRSMAKFNSIIEPALEGLKDKAIIEVQENWMVKEYDSTNEKNNKLRLEILELNKTENISKGRIDRLCQNFKDSEIRFATQEELSIIVELRKEAMNRIGLDELSFENRHRFPEFYREFTLVLLEQTNWCLCYKTNTFFFTESTIKSGFKVLEKRIENVKTRRKKLNTLVKDALDKNAVTVYNKNKDTLLERILEDPNAFSFQDNYVETQRIIADFFMDIKKEIETEIKEETKTKI